MPAQLSSDAVERALDRKESRRNREREERAVAKATRHRDFAPNEKLLLGCAEQIEGYDEAGGWGSWGPPMREARVPLREAVYRGLVVPLRRRTPRSRGAAHRPAARRPATRAGPSSSDDDGEPEPPLPLAAAFTPGAAP